MLKSVSAKQQVSVSTDVAPEVESRVVDTRRRKQVLYNYLSNAIKFTPAGGRVTVRARPEGNDRITHRGRGHRRRHRARADRPAVRRVRAGRRRRARTIGGTGLGLALTKRLVEAQGGEVGVRSTVGKGSTFFAVLPRVTVGKVMEAFATAPPRVVHAAGKPTILVVEDEVADRDALVAALARAGYAVDAVSTGAAALLRAAERSYDAITLDLMLPDMTGLEVLAALRDGRNHAVPVIIVTVVAEHGAVAGFAVHDILGKPLREQDLLASLVRAHVIADGGATTVLVVDDEPASLKVMAATLSRLGYHAVCEQDPARALKLPRWTRSPSAIILDLVMPGMKPASSSSTASARRRPRAACRSSCGRARTSPSTSWRSCVRNRGARGRLEGARRQRARGRGAVGDLAAGCRANGGLTRCERGDCGGDRAHRGGRVANCGSPLHDRCGDPADRDSHAATYSSRPVSYSSRSADRGGHWDELWQSPGRVRQCARSPLRWW